MGDFWRLVTDGGLPGSTNMARDEALLEAMADQPGLPVLRLYTWHPPCLSLGYAQSYYSHVDSEFCSSHGIDVVRRPTGGRAVLHHMELTYAVAFRSDHPVLGGGVLESFRKVSEAILLGLRSIGVDAELVAVQRSHRLSRAANCFMAPSSYEVAVRGRKLVGSAQVRRRGAVLQHGSILLDVNPSLWRGAFADGSGNDLSSLATLRSLGFKGSEGEVRAALVHAFSSVLGGPPLEDNLRGLELALAIELERKHSSYRWVLRR